MRVDDWNEVPLDLAAVNAGHRDELPTAEVTAAV